MFMSVFKTAPRGGDAVAVWRDTGSASADVAGGTGQIGGQGDLYFAMSSAPMGGPDILGCDPVTSVAAPWALRLDEVAFPVGAIAHRHTHAGSGWRHLVSGRLRIETDHGAQIIETGMSWFEPANSPVRAVALQTSGVTRFVRCMVIPQSFVGLSTFQLCNPKDAELERLQLTHRHFDHIL